MVSTHDSFKYCKYYSYKPGVATVDNAQTILGWEGRSVIYEGLLQSSIFVIVRKNCVDKWLPKGKRYATGVDSDTLCVTATTRVEKGN